MPGPIPQSGTIVTPAREGLGVDACCCLTMSVLPPRSQNDTPLSMAARVSARLRK